MHHRYRQHVHNLWLMLVFLVSLAVSPAVSLAQDAAAADIVVVGATPGGIAASVAAARAGRRVILVEYEDHIGGIVSNGLTNADIGNKQAVGGLFYEFTRRVKQYYQAQDEARGAGSENVKLCRDGYWYEADVAEKIFHEMIAEQGDRITLLLNHRLQRAIVEGTKLVGVVVAPRGRLGTERSIRAQAFIDATYEGDLAAMAKAPYRVGRESREEFGEPHAGRVYVRFGTTELLPGSTGESDQAIQGFCFRFHMTDNPANRVPVEKPQGYRRDDYTALLADIRTGRIKQVRQAIQFYPMPNGRYEINSDHPHPDTGVPSESLDLAEENSGWPEATPEERRRIYERYLAHNVGLIWLLQNDAEVPAAIRDEARQFGWCRDLWPGNNHVPRQVYVRQGRRIEGEYFLTQRDGDVDPAIQRTRLQPTSIGIAEFAFDSHGCHRFDSAHPGVREGYIYISHPPLQIPYGVLVPKRVDGLLVPVACSASHVGYQALRMEPLFMALGEAAATAAHVAIEQGVALRSVPVAEVQHRLVAARGVIAHLNDVPFDHPAFAPLQWLGARGFNTGYKGAPDSIPSQREAAERLQRVLRCEGIEWELPPGAAARPVRGQDVAAWLRQAGKGVQADADVAGQELTTAQLARLVYRAFRPTE